MKKIFLIVFLLSFSFGFAQKLEKTIVVRDAATNLPIEDAAIMIMKTKQVILTNKEGKGRFVLKSISNIQVSHFSYSKINFRSTALIDGENIILLRNNISSLDELVITKQPQKILKSLVDNSKRRLTAPARLKVYGREFFKLNGKYAYYNDGLLNFQIFGKTKKFDSNILVEQNRSFGLLEQEVSVDLLGYNLNDIMENYYNFKYLNPVLETSAKKNYVFVINVFSKNKLYNVFKIIPITGTKELLDEYSIVYEPKSNTIISVTTILQPEIIAANVKKTGLGAKNIYKSYFQALYRNDSEGYYLLSSKEEIGFEKIEKKATKTFEVRNYFVTNNFSTQNYSYTEIDVFKDKTLFNKKNVILTDYWNVSGLTATSEEESIIKELEVRD